MFPLSKDINIPCINTLQGHTDYVTAGAFSHNGQLILSASVDKTLKLWNSKGKCIKTLEGHTSGVVACAFRHNDQFIVSASFDKTLKLWDSQGNFIKTLEGHTSWVYDCAFSHNGQFILSASQDSTLKLWDSKGNYIKTLEGHTGGVLACAFSHDDQFILSASGISASGVHDKTLKLWDNKGKCIKTLEGHTSIISACAFSHDDQFIVSADDETIRFWDTLTGQPQRTLTNTRNAGGCVISPDSNILISWSYDNTLKLRDIQTGQCLKILEGHTDNVRACAFSSNGQFILSASKDKTLKLWDASTLMETQPVQDRARPLTSTRTTAPSFITRATAAAWVPSGTAPAQTAAAVKRTPWITSQPAIASPQAHSSSSDGRSWGRVQTSTIMPSLARLKISYPLPATFNRNIDRVSACAFSPDEQMILSAYTDKSLKLWDLNGNCLKIFRGHTDYVRTCAFHPNSKIALSGARDHTLKLWNTESGHCIRTLSTNYANIYSCAFSADGRLILVALGNGTIKLLDSENGSCVKTFEDNESSHNAVLFCVFSPDGKTVLSGRNEGALNLWDITSGKLLLKCAESVGKVWSCAFSPDGKTMLSSSHDYALKLWDTTSGKLLRTFYGGNSGYACAFSPDGRFIIAGGEFGANLWSIEGNHLQTLAHRSVASCIFSPRNGQYILIASDTLELWDGSPLFKLPIVLSPAAATFPSSSPTRLTSSFDAIASTSTAPLPSAPPFHSVPHLPESHHAVSFDATASVSTHNWPTAQAAAASGTSSCAAPQPTAPLPSAPPYHSVLHISESHQISPFGATASASAMALPAPMPQFATPSTVPASSPLGELVTIKWTALNVELSKTIGKGGFADVYLGKWEGTEVAVKHLRNTHSLTEALEQQFIKESQIHARCNFPRIARLFGITNEPGHFALVLEYLPNGSLYEVLHKRSVALPWRIRWEIAIDIASGLAYLHGNKILHRDLKSTNILLDNGMRAKITDFGLSSVKVHSAAVTSVNPVGDAGAVRWRAPETFGHKYRYQTPADIYSYGIILWELATRALPYDSEASNDVIIRLITKNKKEEIPGDCPPALAKQINKCWRDASSRPTAEKLYQKLTANRPPPKAWYSSNEYRSEAVVKKGYDLFPASPEDWQKVLDCYERCPVPRHEIDSVQVIYNPHLEQAFDARLATLERRYGAKVFAPKWPQEKDKTDRTARETIDRWHQQQAQPYHDAEAPHVRVVPTWHGTTLDAADGICASGYAGLGHIGTLYGQGIYSTPDAGYAYRVYGTQNNTRAGALLMNWAASYSAYPVLASDAPNLHGKPAYQNYDAHIIPVKPHTPDPKELQFDPCQPGDQPTYRQMVVFEAAQCLPRYVVTLKKRDASEA